MKKLLYIFLFLSIVACDNEDANDCFQTAGATVQETFSVATFDKLLVNEHIEVIIKEGPQNVVVETGENLLNDIVVNVNSGRLELTDNNNCNFVRDYGITKVYVTTPNLTEIRSSTQFPIRSDGVLNFDDIRLLSEDFENDFTNVGDFHLSLNSTRLRVTSNGISNFYIDGNVNDLSVGFVAGDGRFEGANLIANNAYVFTRSTNDILVNPQVELTGNIYSVGDVISYNNPPTVDVVEHFTGRLIFN